MRPKTNYSAISNRESCEVSPKTKTTAETKRGAPAATAASVVCGKARSSPYLRETACDGSKEMCGPANPPAVTQTAPLSGEILRAPPRIKDRPGMTPPNAACTFVDSVISYVASHWLPVSRCRLLFLVKTCSCSLCASAACARRDIGRKL